MLARHLLTIIVIVTGIVMLVVLGLAVVDFFTKGLRLGQLGYGGIILACLGVFRWSVRAIRNSRSVRDA